MTYPDDELKVAVLESLYRELADRRYEDADGLNGEATETGEVPPISVVGVLGIQKASDIDFFAATLVQRLTDPHDLPVRLAAEEIPALAQVDPLRAEAVLHALRKRGRHPDQDPDDDPRSYLDELGLIGSPWVTEALGRWEMVERCRTGLRLLGMTASAAVLDTAIDPDAQTIANYIRTQANAVLDGGRS